jgi:hypothetical protein
MSTQAAIPAAVAPHTLVAGEDLSGANRRFLALSAELTLIRATGPTDNIIGIQDDKPFAAAGAQVGYRALAGHALLEAGAAFSAGVPLKPDGVGRGVEATTGQQFYARALKASLAAGDVISVVMEAGVVP